MQVFFQAEDGIRDQPRSRGLGDVYKRQHQDYEIKININELIEKRIPCCDLLHPDHCLTEEQVSEIAHDIRMDLNLHDLYKQVDQHIMQYVNAAGIDNKEHWVEPHLPDLDRDIKEEVGIEFD